MTEPQTLEEMRARAIEVGRRLGTITGPRLRGEPPIQRRRPPPVLTMVPLHLDSATLACLAWEASLRGTDARGMAEAIVIEAVERGVARLLDGHLS